ncbi:gastrula zinc finger protein XlCGF57.1-like [Battus philenor]|uniref:gastrula zinc finger protein XlCGF57.1-like n=1 Tax=Battus philenor TaxID=42288 RepID=UPI0035CEE546
MSYQDDLCNLHMCRICLERGERTINLFSNDEQSRSTLNKIFQCFQIKLEYKKQLPSLICKQCIEEVNIAWKLREKCITFEEKLKIYSKSMTEINTKSEDTMVKDYGIEDYIDSGTLSTSKNCYIDLDSNKAETINAEIKCPHCNKTLKSKASVLRHIISMHQKRKYVGKVTGFGVDRRYNCAKCSYATPHSQTLINHMRRHNGERPYQCDCGKSFTQSSSLAAHRKTHSTNTFYTCSICGKQFKHAFSLKRHLYVHESGQFACNICKKLLKSKQSYQAHIQRHYNVFNYSCEDCGSTFVTCSELLNHRKKHIMNKNLECHLCGYKTRAKKSLVIHLKRHAGEKSYKCEICPYSFYTKGDLQRHRRVHTHDKPFTCPTCGQRFTQSPSMNKHMQNVHGIVFKWSDLKQKETKRIKQVSVTETKDIGTVQ